MPLWKKAINIGLIVGALLLLLSPINTHAQETDTDSLVVVYTNLDNTLTLFRAADKSYMTLLPRDIARAYTYELFLAPDQTHVAIYVFSFEREALRRGDNSTQQYWLYVFSLPDGRKILERDLLPADYIFPPANGAEDGTQSAELPYSLDEIAWSPDGTRLVWVEGVSQGDAQLWMLDVMDNSTLTFEDEIGYPDQIRWSPDGSRFIYTSVETFGGGADLVKKGGYVVNPDGSTLLNIEDVSRFWLVEWVNDTQFLWSLYNADSGAAGIFLYDVETELNQEVLGEDFLISIPQWDTSTQTIAFAVPDLSYANISTRLAPGVYILQNLGGNPMQLSDDNNLFGVEFVVEGYLAIGNDKIIHLQDRREFNLNELRWPHFTPDGRYALGEREAKTVLRELSTETEKQISGLFFVEGMWLNATEFVAKVGAYGSVIGYGSVDTPFTNLVEDAGNGPFIGARP